MMCVDIEELLRNLPARLIDIVERLEASWAGDRTGEAIW
jgi:hypothetical protein